MKMNSTSIRVMGVALALTFGILTLRAQNAASYDEAARELDRLIALYPASAAPTHPAPYRTVLAQGSRVRLALSPFL